MMGDRFVLVRADSTKARHQAGRQAIRNTGAEKTMRAELAAAVGGVIAGIDTQPAALTDDEVEKLLGAADLVTLARTAVEYDYRGDVIEAHAPEMPTRFAKQLAQILRGAMAIGMNRDDALRLAIRCARDSMPPLRLALIDDITKHPGATLAEVHKRIDKPRSTVDRQLQALHYLGVFTLDEGQQHSEGFGKAWKVWKYSLAADIDPQAIKIPARTSPDLSLHTPIPHRGFQKSSESSGSGGPGICSDKTGDVRPGGLSRTENRIRQNNADGYDQ
jgi:hypothetical protein